MRPVSRRRLIVLMLLPLALLAALELAFRHGAWEPYARPNSHAGTSVRLKRALAHHELASMDFVTIGNSRAVYGVDHAALAAVARERGQVHANLSMPGTHWMGIGVLTDWLARTRPEVRGGVIAMSAAEFAYPGNGAYELGIVTPFRSWDDHDWVAAHVPVVHGDLTSYGVVSALMAWRDDVRDLLLQPGVRRVERAWWATQPVSERLFTNAEAHPDLCKAPIHTLADCRDAAKLEALRGEPVESQCRAEAAADPAGRMDYASALETEPLPPHMAQVRDLIRAQLRAIRWRQPPVVVLLPLHRIWRDERAPIGAHAWALHVLQPLADDGTIVLLDHTNDFIDGEQTDCAAFWDLYHQTAAGRARLADRLVPEISAALYAPAAPAAPAAAR